jgi:hypothetical protein
VSYACPDCRIDLALATALLAAGGTVPLRSIGSLVLLGALGLDGTVRWIRGVLPAVLAAARAGHAQVVVPPANADEAALVGGIEVLAPGTLAELVDHLTGRQELLSHVRGALPRLLPPLDEQAALEVTAIHSVAGTLPTCSPLITRLSDATIRRGYATAMSALSSAVKRADRRQPRRARRAAVRQGLLRLRRRRRAVPTVAPIALERSGGRHGPTRDGKPGPTGFDRFRPVGRFSDGLANQGGVVCRTGTCSSVVARVGMGAHRDPAWLSQCQRVRSLRPARWRYCGRTARCGS